MKIYFRAVVWILIICTSCLTGKSGKDFSTKSDVDPLINEGDSIIKIKLETEFNYLNGSEFLFSSKEAKTFSNGKILIEKRNSEILPWKNASWGA